MIEASTDKHPANSAKFLNPDEWTKYWQSGSVTTFGHGFNNNYDGEFSEFWLGVLSGRRGHVIDLCCGNGALVWLANEFLDTDNGARITGIDLADIDPFKLLKRSANDFPAVNFLPATSTEQLPFDDGSVDVAISQYGIEYSNTERTLQELSRVVSPSGKLAFIVHRDDSAVVRGGIMNREKYQYLIEGGEFIQTLLELDELFNQHKHFAQLQANKRYIHLIGTLNRLSYHAHHMHYETEEIYESSRDAIRQFMQFAMSMFNGSTRVRDKKRRQKIHYIDEYARLAISRQEDLQSAALSEQQLEELKAQIEAAGFKLVLDRPILYGTSQLCYGHALVAERHS